MSESVLKVTQMNHFSNVITSVKLRQNKISHVIVSRAGLSHCSVTIFLLGCLCVCVCVHVCVCFQVSCMLLYFQVAHMFLCMTLIYPKANEGLNEEEQV